MKEKILRAHKEQSGRHHQNTEFFKGGVQIVHTLTKLAVAGSNLPTPRCRDDVVGYQHKFQRQRQK